MNQRNFKEEKIATIADTAHNKVDLTVSGEEVETQDGITIIPRYYSLRRWSLSSGRGKRGRKQSSVSEFRIPFEAVEDLTKALQQDSSQRRNMTPSYSSFGGHQPRRASAA